MKRKNIVALLSGCMLLVAVCGCSQENNAKETTASQQATVESTVVADSSVEVSEPAVEASVETTEVAGDETVGSIAEYVVLDESDPFYDFVNNNAGAKFESGDILLASDLVFDDADITTYQSYEKVDADNDGEEELHLIDYYGGVIIDWNGTDYQVLAMGGGANELSIADYEGETWLINSDLTHDGRQYYFFQKFQGNEKVDEFSLSAEYWECDYESEETVFMYNEEESTREEFEKITSSLQYK